MPGQHVGEGLHDHKSVSDKVVDERLFALLWLTEDLERGGVVAVEEEEAVVVASLNIEAVDTLREFE